MEPSKRIRKLIRQLFTITDKRKIRDELRVILQEVNALEIQNNNLTIKNRELVDQANEGLPDPIVPF
jgi:hypothetical protein